MTIQEVTTLRLVNQNIASDSSATPLEIVQHMGAMQAQDYYGSLWALGLRTQKTEKEIIAVLGSETVVRTWPQRGTLHFVPAADAKWLVGMSAERLLHGARNRRQALELDDQTLQKSKETLVRVLTKPKLLTRPEVMTALEDAGISTKSGRGYHILWYLSQSGVTFIGPMHGKQQTIGLLDIAAPHPTKLTRLQGIIEHTKRYFVSHGPATIQDFMWWSGFTAADARSSLEAHHDLLISEKINGKEYWLPKASLEKIKSMPRSFLLPGFDEYMLGYKDRSAALHPDHAQKIIPGGNGMFLSTVVIDGQVVGTWRRTIKKDHILLTISPFRALSSSAKKSLEEPVEKYGRFLELPIKLI